VHERRLGRQVGAHGHLGSARRARRHGQSAGGVAVAAVAAWCAGGLAARGARQHLQKHGVPPTLRGRCLCLCDE